MAVQRGAARRYAEALFEVALEHESFDRWIEQLEEMAALLSQDAVVKVFTSPAIPVQAKRDVLQQALPNLDPDMQRFAGMLLNRDRLEIVPDILAHFRGMVQRHRGIETAIVTTAVPIDERLQALLAERLSAVTGRRISLEARVDPAILGGVVAQVGDQLFDGSLRTRLEELRKALAGA